jgi:hypothetical protein
MECTLRNLKQKSLTKAGERVTGADDCLRVSVGVSVQQYSVQCKGYNLIGVTTVEVSTARGTTQEAKYIERWPNTTSAWAGWSRFDIPVDRYDGLHSLLICTSSPWGFLPATRLASRKILIVQNIKKLTGPALWLLCGYNSTGLLSDKKQLIYRYCTRVVEYIPTG